MRISSTVCGLPQQATANSMPNPDWQIPAHVIAVIPTADRSKGTVTVRIGLDQKDARILPEMGVRVSFLADPSQEPDGKPAGGVSLPEQCGARVRHGRHRFRRARRRPRAEGGPARRRRQRQHHGFVRARGR